MKWLDRLFRKRTRESQLDAELRFHIEQKTADLIAQGVEPTEARRRAMAKLGGIEAVKQEYRESRATCFFESVLQDTRYALRTLRKSPGFAVVAILTLALGIGVNLAVVGILNAWLLEPLRFPHSNRIVIAYLKNPKRPGEPGAFDQYRDLLAWRHASRQFSSVSGAFWHSYILQGAGSARGLLGMIVTRNFFSTFRAQPELGRTFLHSDLRGSPPVVLSDSLWREDFGGSPSLLGKSVTLSGKAYIVVGVMPRSFDFRISNQPKGAQLWTLIQPNTPGYGPNDRSPIAVIGRLRRGATPTGAQAELSVIFRHVEGASPDALRHFRVSVTSLQDFDTQSVRSSLLLGEAAVALLLLIACANLAGLLLARAAQREKEMAVRMALGSSRGRLIRQFLAENAIIAILGAGAGVLVAEVCFRLFREANPWGTLPPQPIGLDGRVLIAAALLAMLAAVLVSLPHALQASRASLAEGLKAGSRNSSAGPRATKGRRALVVGEIAVTVVLVTGAALLTQTMRRLLRQPLGFTTNHVTVLILSLPNSLVATTAKREDFYGRLTPALRALPSMETVGISNCSMLFCGETTLESGVGSSNGNSGVGHAAEQIISLGYFASLRIPLLRGRPFTRFDARAAMPVAILNRSAARMLGMKDPIGRRIRLGKNDPWRTIVGIAGDTSSINYRALGWQTQPRVYIPLAQAVSANSNPVGAELFVTLRGRGNWTDGELRRAVASVSDQVPTSVYSLHQIIAEQFRQPESRAVFLGGLGFMGLLLAALGVYGVIAQTVGQQTHEIGIRVALGAQRADVLHMVISQGAKLVFIGLAIGVGGALALTRFIASQLYGVAPTDPATFFGVAAVMAIVALTACYIPARRAMLVDPVVALRQE
jgi:putative ABC transport system permease protein